MRITTILIAILLAGCGGAPVQEPEFYLLRSDSPSNGSQAGEVTEISLGNVQVANYINRSGIVLETSKGTLRPARYHLWAEPLREGLRTYLADEISSFLDRPVRPANYGDTDWRESTVALVDIHVEELHGTADGAARLSARWAVVDPSARRVMAEYQFDREEPLTADGYSALVSAEKRLLRNLAEAIAESLAQLK